MNNPLAVITIPRFITRVTISDKRRKKYYKKSDRIPKKYSSCTFDRKGYLLDDKGAKIVKNSKSAGTPKELKLSGNNLITGYSSFHMRNKITTELKKFYMPFVKEFVKTNGAIQKFPLRVEWEVHTDTSNPNWDASNLFFYYKYFEDTLFMDEVKAIPDDCIKYITWSPGAKIVPIDNWDDRKFIFKFYYDDRPELKREPWINL